MHRNSNFWTLNISRCLSHHVTYTILICSGVSRSSHLFIGGILTPPFCRALAFNKTGYTYCTRVRSRTAGSSKAKIWKEIKMIKFHRKLCKNWNIKVHWITLMIPSFFVRCMLHHIAGWTRIEWFTRTLILQPIAQETRHDSAGPVAVISWPFFQMRSTLLLLLSTVSFCGKNMHKHHQAPIFWKHRAIQFMQITYIPAWCLCMLWIPSIFNW